MITVFVFLVVFVLAGIGADDVFVYIDTWKHSAAIPEIAR